MINDSRGFGTAFGVRLATAAALIFGAAGVGCGGYDPDAPVTLDKTSEAVVVQTNYSDASGRVQFSIQKCSMTPAATGLRCAYCPVATGYVLIGGGAEIIGSPTSARLKASRPDAQGTAVGEGCTGDFSSTATDVWLARSYSLSPTQHQLQAYSVGMKVTGMSATDLQAYVSYNENTVAASQQPTLTVPTFSHTLIGGGAELLGPDGGGPSGYLTESRPSDPNGANASWTAVGRFGTGKSGSLKVLAIGLDLGLGRTDGTWLSARWRSSTSSAANVTVPMPFPWASAMGGATGVTNGSSSRYLSDLIPLGTSQGFSVSTKEEGAAVSGNTTGYALGLADFSWQPYWFNVIRFIYYPTAFSRAPGAAPVDLQQSTAAPTTNALHWYLEDRGSGRYRIRNGNPQQGTECAGRDPNNPGSVRVMPCGTSNDFLFTIDLGGLADSFRLRNVGNGRCIDNQNSSTSGSTLVFRTCPASDVIAPTMQIYLWSNNWPL